MVTLTLLYGCLFMYDIAGLGHVIKHDVKNMVKLISVIYVLMLTRKPFHSVERNSQVLRHVHSDTCDLNSLLAHGGKRYLKIFIDDYS